MIVKGKKYTRRRSTIYQWNFQADKTKEQLKKKGKSKNDLKTNNHQQKTP